MSEDEIIQYIEEHFDEVYKDCMKDCDGDEDIFVFQYMIKKFKKEMEQEKEKNKELQGMLQRRIEYTGKLEKDLFENASNYVISKDKIRAKIEELEKEIEEKAEHGLDFTIIHEHEIDIRGIIKVLQDLLKE